MASFKMTRATPQMRDLAKRLIVHEMRRNKSLPIEARRAFSVCEKLGLHLRTIVGSAGVAALISRSLIVTNEEVGWLRGVAVKTDGSLEGLDDLDGKVDPEEIVQGSVVLVAQLLGLLLAFIGESLTVGIVREVWPKVSLGHLDFGKRVKR